MSETRKKTGAVDRRSFMQIAGLGAGAAGAAAFGMSAGAEDATALEANGASASGYRETDHIRAYYKHSRF